MSSNLSNLGFRINSPQEFQALASKAAASGNPVPTFVGGAYLHTSTPEGVELWTQISPEKELIGCHLHFVGGSKYLPGGGVLIEVQRIIDITGAPLDGRLVGTMASEGGYDCPIVFDVPDFRQYAARLPLHSRVRVQIAALPSMFKAFPTEDAFHADQMSMFGKPGMAGEAFIPSGTFKPDGEVIEPRVADAVLTGRIVDCERRVNSFSGLLFYALTVKTLGGVIDVAVDPVAVSSDPVVGGVVWGNFWLSGRILDPLPPYPAMARQSSPPPLPTTDEKKTSKWKFW